MSEEFFILNHAAATIRCKKASSLVCLKSLGGCISDDMLDRLEKVGVSSMRLTNRISCPLILLYRRDMVEDVLSVPEVRELLYSLGYRDFSFSGIMEYLRRRFMESLCPDEIGLFLGYPIRDVFSYIEKQGRDPLYSGYWKVYHDVEGARNLEQCFRCARLELIEALNKGESFEDIISA